jgi:hypothetical protein
MTVAWEFVGALGILIPFALLQFGRMSQHAYLYLLLNLIGSGILTVVAILQQQWGFVILQGVWAVAAAWGLVRRSRTSRSSPETADPAADPDR